MPQPGRRLSLLWWLCGLTNGIPERKQWSGVLHATSMASWSLGIWVQHKMQYSAVFYSARVSCGGPGPLLVSAPVTLLTKLEESPAFSQLPRRSGMTHSSLAMMTAAFLAIMAEASLTLP